MVIKIKKLNQLKVNEQKNKYLYKNINFMIDIKKVDNLIIMFHARVLNMKPIYRGRQYYFKKASVLSISDSLFELYRIEKKDKLFDLSWYIETNKCKFHNNIIELIDFLKENYEYKKLIFVGQCSGALMAVYMASFFNGIAVFTNPHLILHKEVQNRQWYKQELPYIKKVLTDNDDNILNEKYLDVRNFKPPKKIYGFSHIKDYTYHNVNLYKEYLNKINYNNYDIVEHDTEPAKNRTPHHTHFTKNFKNMKKFLETLL